MEHEAVLLSVLHSFTDIRWSAADSSPTQKKDANSIQLRREHRLSRLGVDVVGRPSTEPRLLDHDPASDYRFWKTSARLVKQFRIGQEISSHHQVPGMARFEPFNGTQPTLAREIGSQRFEKAL
jgi:hypothetical protein